MTEWVRGVSVDRVMFASSLLIRAQERGFSRLLKATGDGAPEYAVAPREMRLAINFLTRAGFALPEVVDEGELWLISATPTEAP